MRFWIVGLLLSAATSSHAQQCVWPTPPDSLSGMPIFEQRARAWAACTGAQPETVRIRRNGEVTFEDRPPSPESRQKQIDTANRQIAEVRMQLQSQELARQTETQSGQLGAAGDGSDCRALERELTAQSERLAARVSSAGLCEAYKLSVELGEINARLYSACPILDVDGTYLESAREMIRAGREGQRGGCTQ
jgi:hypothetical protein